MRAKTNYDYQVLATVALILVLLTACNRQPAGSLHGTVSIGPMQMVDCQIEDVPASLAALFTSRALNVFEADGETLVKRVPFDACGAYSLELPAGNYVVDIEPNGLDVGVGLPANVNIEAGEATRLDIEIDNGVR